MNPSGNAGPAMDAHWVGPEHVKHRIYFVSVR